MQIDSEPLRACELRVAADVKAVALL